jgi:hypothetical protein
MSSSENTTTAPLVSTSRTWPRFAANTPPLSHRRQRQQLANEDDRGLAHPAARQKATEIGVRCDNDGGMIECIGEDLLISCARADGIADMLGGVRAAGQQRTQLW